MSGKGKVYPTLGMVTTISDSAFAEQLGTEPSEYAAFRDAWLARRPKDANARSDGVGELELTIPWLPDGFDLAKHLLAEEDVL